MYWTLITKLAIVVTVGYLAWNHQHQIRESVAAWLREQGLQNSALMKAWIVFDRFISGVRRRLMVETNQTGLQKISETTHSLEEIRKTDPDVYDQLQRLGYAEKDVMHLLQ
ncbi:hypothetical protein RIVM261_041530 [Rivularia sp. IAM M-261]|nr:hypothetical protein RIVM261_041530 [Rivularia sp. IAM M-261]